MTAIFSGAANALSLYKTIDTGAPAPDATAGADSGSGFAGMLGRALQGAIDQQASAETQAKQAIAGDGDLTQVVTAVSRAELTLQTTVAIRDRVLQAYQDIIKMPI
jgi:flagellar hook-basal body complex protein FliE